MVESATRPTEEEPVPRYEYRCRACGDTFEEHRPMAASADPATCPSGHDDTVKLLSTIALTGRGGGMPAPAAPRATGGGCCGGACGC
jgi:putative FmdB family regulatory protein